MILILDLNGLDGSLIYFWVTINALNKAKSFPRVFCDSMYQKEKRKHLFKHLFYQTFVRNQITNNLLNAFNDI